MAHTKFFGDWMIFPIIILVAMLFLAAGCSSLGDKSKSKPLPLPEIYTGFDGVDVAFSPESIPKGVAAGSNTNLLLLVSNKGAVVAPNAIITVKDTRGAFTLKDAKDGDKFAFFAPLIVGALNGKESSPSAAGDVEGIVLTMNAKPFLKNEKGEVVENSIDTGLVATVCYEYGTKLTANVCVDASSYSFQKQRKPCDYTVPLVFTKGQGAPVAITRIETLDPDKTGGFVKPRFKIFIANAGKGIVIKNDVNVIKQFCAAPDSATKTDDKPRVNVVRIVKATLHDQTLKCSDTTNDFGGKVLTGIASKDYILCNYPEPNIAHPESNIADGSGTFTTPLAVELSYGYTFTTTPVPVTVEKGIS